MHAYVHVYFGGIYITWGISQSPVLIMPSVRLNDSKYTLYGRRDEYIAVLPSVNFLDQRIWLQVVILIFIPRRKKCPLPTQHVKKDTQKRIWNIRRLYMYIICTYTRIKSKYAFQGFKKRGDKNYIVGK